MIKKIVFQSDTQNKYNMDGESQSPCLELSSERGKYVPLASSLPKDTFLKTSLKHATTKPVSSNQQYSQIHTTIFISITKIARRRKRDS